MGRKHGRMIQGRTTYGEYTLSCHSEKKVELSVQKSDFPAANNTEIRERISVSAKIQSMISTKKRSHSATISSATGRCRHSMRQRRNKSAVSSHKRAIFEFEDNFSFMDQCGKHKLGNVQLQNVPMEILVMGGRNQNVNPRKSTTPDGKPVRKTKLNRKREVTCASGSSHLEKTKEKTLIKHQHDSQDHLKNCLTEKHVAQLNIGK